MKDDKKQQEIQRRIQKNVEKSHKYFSPNYSRYNDFRKFVFKTSLSSNDLRVLDETKKPQIEFNIGEAYISRLRGEFAKYEPAISVSAQDGFQVEPDVLDFYEGHIRYILTEANNNGCEYNVYSDTLSGGFSGLKIWTEYAHSMSFDQIIKIGRVSDPCLIGFDPLARLPHKADGEYAFELSPMTKSEFKIEYPDVDLTTLDFKRESEGFNWTYTNVQEEILMVCDYYEKKKKRTKIVQLSDGKTLRLSEYKKFMQEWDSMARIEQPPKIVQERTTELETICRYRLIKNHILEYKETDFKCFPIIFVDGNSILLRDSSQSSVEQMTRPYVYHIKGTQKLKNFAGQTLANELENMVQHKFMIAKEAIPIGYEDAYKNVQLPSTIVYNAYNNNNPDQQLPQPREIQRTATPPEVMGAFQVSDQVLQAILGSYDAQAGNINESGLSGKAIIEGTTNSNAAAMPYIVAYLQSWNQLAQEIAHLIPRYYTSPRTIPIIGKDGKHEFVKINQEGGISLDHDENAIHVKVQAGTSFGLQKSRALQQIIALMQSSELFAQFMNTEGLPILLDNIEIRGIDQLKNLATEWMQKMQQQQEEAKQQQQQMMQQQASQPDPAMFQMQLLQQEQELNAQKLKLQEMDMMLKDKKIDVDSDLKSQQNTTERLKVLGMLEQEAMKNDIELKKSQVDEFSRSVEMALKTEKEMHTQAKDHAEFEIKTRE